jgi:hypothetical protein
MSTDNEHAVSLNSRITALEEGGGGSGALTRAPQFIQIVDAGATDQWSFWGTQTIVNGVFTWDMPAIKLGRTPGVNLFPNDAIVSVDMSCIVIATVAYKENDNTRVILTGVPVVAGNMSSTIRTWPYQSLQIANWENFENNNEAYGSGFSFGMLYQDAEGGGGDYLITRSALKWLYDHNQMGAEWRTGNAIKNPPYSGAHPVLNMEVQGTTLILTNY